MKKSKFIRWAVPVCLIVITAAFIKIGGDDLPVVKLNDQAPEIEMKNPAGEIVRLSSLKGKVVLVDFWASWCNPCRRENQNLVKAYHKYKGKKFTEGQGFTVFSVALESDGQIWKKAIDNDNMTWPYHVSDLKKWESPVVDLYGIKKLPTNFLISGSGKVLAIDLMGSDLEAALDKMLSE